MMGNGTVLIVAMTNFENLEIIQVGIKKVLGTQGPSFVI
jgi:hypothetical protein